MKKRGRIFLTEKEKIRRLEAENRRLRRENAYLKQWYDGERRAFDEKTSLPERYFAERLQQKAALRAKTYFGYLMEKFRRSRSFLVYDKTRFLMRGFFFARKLWYLFVLVVTALGISAQFLFLLTTLAIFLPAALISSFVIGFYGYFRHRKWNRLFYEILREKEKVYLFFLPKRKTGFYFSHWCENLSENATVFLISFSFRDCRFSSVSALGENIYKIHVSYYFSLIKRLDYEKIIRIYL